MLGIRVFEMDRSTVDSERLLCQERAQVADCAKSLSRDLVQDALVTVGLCKCELECGGFWTSDN